MNTENLFTKPIPELEALPKKPKVFWYVSAGVDFRGLVFLTQHHIAHEAKHHGKHFIKPDLFVYNCLGSEVVMLREKLRQGNPVLYKDDLTTITGKNYSEFGINSNIMLEASLAFVDIGSVHIPKPENAAFYFEVEVKGSDYTEIQKVLYVEHENIDFFHKVILKNHFDIVYLCATREGCGMGGCKKSIIEHIYKDTSTTFYIDKSFTSRYCIVFKYFSKDTFEDAVRNNPLIFASLYGSYINEIVQKDGVKEHLDNATIFRLEYGERVWKGL